jgi:hypothetical protein
VRTTARPAGILLGLLLACPVGLAAQDSPVRAFAGLIGGVWEAQGEIPALGRFRAERTHEWALDGRYLRIRQTMSLADGRSIEEETLIGWDPGPGHFLLWGFASDGSRSHGTGQAVDASRFVFTGRTEEQRAADWRMTSFLIDESTMSVLVEVRGAGAYQPAMTLAFRRRAVPPATER